MKTPCGRGRPQGERSMAGHGDRARRARAGWIGQARKQPDDEAQHQRHVAEGDTPAMLEVDGRDLRRRERLQAYHGFQARKFGRPTCHPNTRPRSAR